MQIKNFDHTCWYQELLLALYSVAVLKNHKRCYGLNPVWPCVRKASYHCTIFPTHNKNFDCYTSSNHRYVMIYFHIPKHLLSFKKSLWMDIYIYVYICIYKSVKNIAYISLEMIETIISSLRLKTYPQVISNKME